MRSCRAGIELSADPAEATIQMHTRDRFRGCLLGLACGDAVGTTVEFRRRGAFPPVTDMTGGGPFGLRPGEWTDDTSMALCLASSLVDLGRFDPADQMARYARWYREGYWSSTGKCFDIGTTVAAAIHRFENHGEPLSGSTDPRSAGNGCIMRLAPVPMFYFPDRESGIEMSGESSRTTHGAAECIDSCRLLAAILFQALSGATKDTALFDHGLPAVPTPKVQKIASGAYRAKSDADIRGTGYVVDSLEAALWCFHRTESFPDAILAAANLGDDADTTAAVCGQTAGAFYGESGIPPRWLDRLAMRTEIRDLADRLHDSTTPPVPA